MEGKCSKKSLLTKLKKLEDTKDAIDKLIRTIFIKVTSEIQNLLVEDDDVFLALAEEKNREADAVLTKLKLVLDHLEREGESSSGIEEEDSSVSSPSLPQSSSILIPLPLQLGTETKALITHFEEITSFWVEPQNHHSITLINLLDDYNLKSPEDLSTGPYNFSKNDFCMATRNCDETFWLRAKVLERIQPEEHGPPYVNLFFLDIGATETQSLSKLRPMPESLKKFHPQAVHCCLKEVPLSNGSSSVIYQLNEQFKYFLAMPNVYVTFHSPLSSGRNPPQYFVDVVIKVSSANNVFEFPLSFASLRKMMDVSSPQLNCTKILEDIVEINIKISKILESWRNIAKCQRKMKSRRRSSTQENSFVSTSSDKKLSQVSSKASTLPTNDVTSSLSHQKNDSGSLLVEKVSGHSVAPSFENINPPSLNQRALTSSKIKASSQSLDLLPPSFFSLAKTSSDAPPTSKNVAGPFETNEESFDLSANIPTSKLPSASDHSPRSSVQEAILPAGGDESYKVANAIYDQNPFDNTDAMLQLPPRNTAQAPPSDESSEEDWDPMSQDFSNLNNNYAINFDDPEIAVIGYKAQDERTICKFYERNGRCRRKERCQYKHIRKAPDDYTTRDKEALYTIQAQQEIPPEGSILIAMISAYYTPSHFYLVFPYGRESFQVLANEISTDSSHEDDTLPELMNHMRNRYHFTKPVFMPGVHPANGSEVACTDGNGHWYRCRITDVDEGHIEAFLIDFGSQEIFPLDAIRNLHSDYIYIPPQALECFLSGVRPILPISNMANERFKQLIEGELVLAKFNKRTNPHEALVSLTLFKPPTPKSSRSLAEILIEEGLAEPLENLASPSHHPVPMSIIVPE